MDEPAPIEPPAPPPAPPAVPAFADGSARALEPAWIVVERTGGLIFSVVLVLAGAAGFTALAAAGRLPAALTWILGGVLLSLSGALLAFSALWPVWEYARCGYRLLPDRIEVWRGLLWRRSTGVPVSRVQYTDVKQGPLMRRHGIATLVIHTAGTLGAEVELPGLPPELATAIRDWLVHQSGSDAV